jgi:orotidine-5'-phosphate decarboxylase
MSSGNLNPNSLPMLNPIIVALDVDTAESANSLAQKLKGKVGAFKLGPRLLVRYGASLASEIAKSAPVFIDNKYLDIPSTMDAAVRASFEAGATLATVHAWAGPEALSMLSKTEKELSQQRPFRILVVTLLTSFTKDTLPYPSSRFEIDEQVSALSESAISFGLSGIVCSPHEVSALRKRHTSAFLVTPGVRMPDDDKGDQKRVLTPYEACERGASALVIGRPIIAATDPVEACERILQNLGPLAKGTL